MASPGAYSLSTPIPQVVSSSHFQFLGIQLQVYNNASQMFTHAVADSTFPSEHLTSVSDRSLESFQQWLLTDFVSYY